jgi:hypothetical protein
VFPESAPGAADWEVDLPGFDFDTDGVWYTKTGAVFDNDPDLVTKPAIYETRTLYGLLTQNGRDRTGASSEVYLVLHGDTATAPLFNNGVFKVVGAGTAAAGYTNKDATAADRLRVEPVVFGFADFTSATGLNAELRTQFTHSKDGDGFASGRSAACVVITDIEGSTGGTTNPWNTLMATPIQSKLSLRTALIYHPGRGGLARVAAQIHRVAVVSGGSEYLRQTPTATDASFPPSAGVPDDEIYFDLNHIQTWNRLSGLGLDAPTAPAYGGEIASFTEQDREAECFTDSGSKTLMLRPFQTKSMSLHRRTATAALFPATYLAGHDVDGANIFHAARTRGYALPPEYMPRFGRQDIPYFVDVAGTGSGTFLDGINHLFVDTLDETDPQFNVVGGLDQGVGGGVAGILFQTTATVTSGLDYGEFGPVPPGSLGSAFQCRLYEDPDVVSSDLGRGLKGIQLPPFYGVARIYGIYERTDFENAGGVSMFETDRITPIAGAAPNLMRTDARKQTLFIVQNGANDVITSGNAHTYVIPFDAIDVRLSNSFTTGTTEEDYEYIVEAVVFGFAQGWINKNTYIVSRLNKGAAGGGTDVDLDGAEMVLPAAAPLNDQFYVAYNRVPYQGDPYMSRDGSTRVVSDYEHRYGQIPQEDAFELNNPIQQFDSDGETVIQTPNARALQVLASVDFWTTLGTGKIGGRLFAGTVLDVGHTKNTVEVAGRVPEDDDDPPWQVDVRAFTLSQRYNPSKASLEVVVIDNTALVAGDGLIITGPTGPVSILAGTDYAIGANATATATNIAAAINANADLITVVSAFSAGAPVVTITAIISGSAGNLIEVGHNDDFSFLILVDEEEAATGSPTHTFLQGGVDVPANSGDGTSSQALTGLTERLPLGILVQDSDFIGEDLLRNGTGQLQSFLGGLGGAQVATPLLGGEEFTRLVGGTGQFIGLADGGILKYGAFHESTNPTGTKKFRLFRGGGSVYVLSQPRPGGPVDWVSGSLLASNQPVLKGGVLACKALLVRNFPEVAFTGGERTSYGDEIQMVVLTRGVIGKGTERTTGVSLTGIVSPTGYGEGYAAADRYRLAGLPLVTGHGSTGPDTAVDLAVFPFDDLTFNSGT